MFQCKVVRQQGHSSTPYSVSADLVFPGTLELFEVVKREELPDVAAHHDFAVPVVFRRGAVHERGRKHHPSGSFPIFRARERKVGEGFRNVKAADGRVRIVELPCQGNVLWGVNG